MKEYKAWIDNFHSLQLEGPIVNDIVTNIDRAYAIGNGEKIHLISEGHTIDENTVRFYSEDSLPVDQDMFLYLGELEIPIYVRGVVRTEKFDEKYGGSREDLGAVYYDIETIFRVWSPVATEMKLHVNESVYEMKRKKFGVWEYTLTEDCHGYTYLFIPTLNKETYEVVDPYAKAVTTNGEYGVVVNLETTDPDEFRETPRPVIENLQDSSIYEMHIRDATIDSRSGIVDKGKYLGLTEKDAKTVHQYSSGLSYIKELGVSHVQLLPVNDFARVDDLEPNKQYNWGYDPLFFQVPEGSYSVDPTDPFARITELKELIHSFHEEGLSVIIDVVYNHVFVKETSSFEKLVPGYYFRYHDNGTVSNGTGVGNDIATEKRMARKFILDTIEYWLREYQVDGFRFDLMGAIDLTTMQQIQNSCKKEETPILLLGEGWGLQTAFSSEKLSTSFQSHHLPGIRFFNDVFRDTIKGNLFESHDHGFVNGKGRYIERLTQLVKGSAAKNEDIPPFVHEVTQTVNYVECHDNHTLSDRLEITNSSDTNEERMKMHKMATGLTIVSQGIPFIHAGQEWFRSKSGDENSYISGDKINQLDWKRRGEKEEDIQYVRDLLSIRKEYSVFRMTKQEDINRHLHVLITPPKVFGFTLLAYKNDLCIYANPTEKDVKIELPSSGDWEILVTSLGKHERTYFSVRGKECELRPYEFIILRKSRL
ncbi:type I pullulanase [Salipaludibacillus neizhouensis]|nr:type I pullulanase [Salipaludibacillus neizhouensis]